MVENEGERDVVVNGEEGRGERRQRREMKKEKNKEIIECRHMIQKNNEKIKIKKLGKTKKYRNGKIEIGGERKTEK